MQGMADWLAEGAADRSFTRPDPVVHLVVRGGTGWNMWCTGGRARPGVWNSPDARLCGTCKRLACDGVDDGTVDSADVARWLP